MYVEYTDLLTRVVCLLTFVQCTMYMNGPHIHIAIGIPCIDNTWLASCQFIYAASYACKGERVGVLRFLSSRLSASGLPVSSASMHAESEQNWVHYLHS